MFPILMVICIEIFLLLEQKKKKTTTSDYIWIDKLDIQRINFIQKYIFLKKQNQSNLRFFKKDCMLSSSKGVLKLIVSYEISSVKTCQQYNFLYKDM